MRLEIKVWGQAGGETNHYISNMSITIVIVLGPGQLRYRTPFEYAGQTHDKIRSSNFFFFFLAI